MKRITLSGASRQLSQRESLWRAGSGPAGCSGPSFRKAVGLAAKGRQMLPMRTRPSRVRAEGDNVQTCPTCQWLPLWGSWHAKRD